MLIPFFYTLREAKLPVSVKEYLTLLEALKAGVIGPSIDDFYFLSRITLVKDEAHFDRFDKAFGAFFNGVAKLTDSKEIPEDWLRQLIERELTPEQKAAISAMGWDELMKTLQQRLEEQKGRHEGGSKWIGTAGTSPFGNQGYNPEGVRIGQSGSRHRRALKVWEARDYRNLDDGVELGTRNIKMALRRLRRFAREGAPEELDLDGTIDSTARSGGFLDIRLQPERRNAVKLLLLLDVGGSMDPHVKICEELFSAARAEFKHLEYFYFHNFPYERLWKDNQRRFSEITDTWSVLRTFNSDYRVVLVGDATMSPYEIEQPGGSVEHWNAESGRVWMTRIAAHFPRLVWLNPEPEDRWNWTMSIETTRELISGRMFPLTLDGLDRAMHELKHGRCTSSRHGTTDRAPADPH